MEKQCQSSFSYLIVFSFSLTILSKSVWTLELMMNARGVNVGFKAFANKFYIVVTLKNFYMSKMLIFHKFLKLNENIIEVRF